MRTIGVSDASDPLYKTALLRLAADAEGAGRLAAPGRSATRANPACGDRVTVDITLEGGRISALAHDTRACILTQASAALLPRLAADQTADQIATLRKDVATMLAEGAPPPHADYAVFDGAAAHPGRHVCVLLPLDALLAALETPEPGA